MKTTALPFLFSLAFATPVSALPPQGTFSATLGPVFAQLNPQAQLSVVKVSDRLFSGSLAFDQRQAYSFSFLFGGPTGNQYVDFTSKAFSPSGSTILDGNGFFVDGPFFNVSFEGTGIGQLTQKQSSICRPQYTPVNIPNDCRMHLSNIISSSSAGDVLSFDVIGFAAGSTERLQEGFAPALPEPASWLLMLLGFGLVGTALRRRHTGGLAQA